MAKREKKRKEYIRESSKLKLLNQKYLKELASEKKIINKESQLNSINVLKNMKIIYLI